MCEIDTRWSLGVPGEGGKKSNVNDGSLSPGMAKEASFSALSRFPQNDSSRDIVRFSQS